MFSGSTAAESQANFFWLDLGDRDEDDVMRELGGRGVAVRAGAGLGSPRARPRHLRDAARRTSA